ncbi:MAG: hypothetical protein M1825_004738 [Sarcosagium campestre]|nr:MAG: hypothetical protein M1825_004738 [Sarcosagium campestre]
MRLQIAISVFSFFLFSLTSAWGKEDHEIFRLRDEVAASEGPDVTFYDFLGISPSASQNELRKAYYKKSKLIHPDKARQSFIASKSMPTPKGKNDSKKKPGVHVSKRPSQSEIRQATKLATERFTRLGIVKDILTGEGRERYDHFLKNGFPRWRGTGYYYSRVKPGLFTVLIGLFVFGGGGAHYGALYLSWKRQRDFVDRYIRHARRAAWGDETGIKGIPGLEGTVTPPINPAEDDIGVQGLNRRQRRMQEKEKGAKKPKKTRESSNGVSEKSSNGSGPRGEKKRIVAENGKVLIVDAEGNVYLEEENEDGEKGEYLLDVDEIPRPTLQQTVLVRLPRWLFAKTAGRLIGAPIEKDAGEILEESDATSDGDNGTASSKSVSLANNIKAKRRAKRRERAH